MSSSQRLSFSSAFHPIMVSFLINSILPARVGEIARPAIIKKQNQVPFTVGLTTVAAERVFDLLSLIIIFTWVLAMVNIDPHLIVQYKSYQLNKQTLEIVASGIIKVCVALITGIVLISLSGFRRRLKSFVMKFPSIFFFTGSGWRAKMKKKCSMPLVNIIDNIASGFSFVKEPLNILICLGYSFFIWIIEALSLYILMLGCPGIALSFFEITAVLIIIFLFIALPSAPGFWGLWEAGGVFALTLFGVSADAAAGFSLVTHAVSTFMVLIIGTISALLTGVNILKISYQQ